MSTDADTEAGGGEPEQNERKGRGGVPRGPWTVPVTAAVMGGVFLAIYLSHHDVGMAVSGLVIMIAYAAVLVFGSRRSEAVALLRGETGDERRRSIELRASALTLHVLTLVLVGGYLVSLIRGHESMTWAGLCAVLGATYLLSTIILTRRG
ncbi:hypothetical protein ABH935_009658 [Catenulispora sp. GAS73]|uniref:hypothetical protein n=1 Tax=Catenulispora sp. GAS73 TaxID=3156269 RepID=UPI003519B2C7